MNGKKAKKIRKEVYGDMSKKAKRKYVAKNVMAKRLVDMKDDGNRVIIMNHPDSLRAKYQAAKKRALVYSEGK